MICYVCVLCLGCSDCGVHCGVWFIILLLHYLVCYTMLLILVADVVVIAFVYYVMSFTIDSLLVLFWLGCIC